MYSISVIILDGKGGSKELKLNADSPLSELGLEVAKRVKHPDLPIDGTPFKALLKRELSNQVIPLEKSLYRAGVLPGDRLFVLIKSIPPALVNSVVILGYNGPGFIHLIGTTYLFQGENILVGRVDPDTGIIANVLGVDLSHLEDTDRPSTSRRHAQILLRDGEYLLQDLNSTNGTLVNGRLLAPDMRCPLEHGDKVQFGDIVLYFIWDAQT